MPGDEKQTISILREFREFAMKGNVVDLAIGVIMGAAFGPIVSTLVDNVIMPPIGLALGGVDFSNYMAVLHSDPDPDQSGCHQIWPFSERAYQIRDHGRRHLHARQGDEPG